MKRLENYVDVKKQSITFDRKIGESGLIVMEGKGRTTIHKLNIKLMLYKR